jgi:hypothetical protein
MHDQCSSLIERRQGWVSGTGGRRVILSGIVSKPIKQLQRFGHVPWRFERL